MRDRSPKAGDWTRHDPSLAKLTLPPFRGSRGEQINLHAVAYSEVDMPRSKKLCELTFLLQLPPLPSSFPHPHFPQQSTSALAA
jgi:hypothetical protein